MLAPTGNYWIKFFDCIGLSRTTDDAKQSIYLSNILNWRPPGNRTPTDEEVDIARPFIKRHVELINPDIIVFCGGMPAQALLNSKESVSRLRNRIHDYNGHDKGHRNLPPVIPSQHTITKEKSVG